MVGVADKNDAVVQMHAVNNVVRALLGGTDAMRSAGKIYLPQWPQETDDCYATRLATATLLPVLQETVRQMVGRVFYRNVDTSAIAAPVLPLIENIDLRNNHLSVFCSQWFADALAFGASYAVADYPMAGGVQTLADAQAMGLRPYAVLVKNADVLGFKSAMVNGVEVCTQFRYVQDLTVDDGEFGTKTILQVNVLEPGRIRRYRNEGNGWVLAADNEMRVNGRLLDFVPVVEFTPERRGFFAGHPPLLELAHLNVKHWQSQSDQDNITHYVRVPLLVFQSAEEAPDVLAASAGNLISVGASGGLSYVEHSGASIGAGAAALEKLENDMLAAGAKLLVRTKLALTESQAQDEKGKEVSLLRHYANLFEDSIGRLLDMLAAWQGADNGGKVELSGNIEDTDALQGFDVLLKLNAAGALSDESLFEEAKRRGFLSEAVQWQDEKARLDSDSGPMSFS